MKYAIVESGGKQYKAVEGTSIEVDRLTLEVGKEIELEDVLLISNDGEVVIGSPTIEGARVAATVVDQFKGPKIVVFKYKSRVRYRVKQGHRQKYTRLMIDQVLAKGEKKAEKPVVEKKPPVEKKPVVEAQPKAEAKPKTKSAPKTAAKTKTAPKPKTKTAAKPKTKTSTKKAATKTSTKKSDKKSE